MQHDLNVKAGGRMTLLTLVLAATAAHEETPPKTRWTAVSDHAIVIPGLDRAHLRVKALSSTTKPAVPELFAADRVDPAGRILREATARKYEHVLKYETCLDEALPVDQRFPPAETAALARALRSNAERKTATSVVFLHVPKTGGSTVSTHFEAMLRRKGCRQWDVQAHMSELAAGAAAGLDAGAACSFLHIGSGRPGFPLGSLKVAARFADEAQVAGVHGHITYGACDYVGLNCTYATLLREPHERFVSHVRWECKMVPDRHGAACDSFDAFMDKLARNETYFYGVDNMQTRMIAGEFWKVYDRETFKRHNCKRPAVAALVPACAKARKTEVTYTALRAALRNIATGFAAVGRLDEMEGFISRLAGITGVDYDVPIHKENKNSADSAGLATSTVPQAHEAAIAKLNWADTRLYHFAGCAQLAI